MFKYFKNPVKYLLLFLIKIYQKTLSLDHGPLKKIYPHGYCRFYPSCSEYGFLSIKKYGVIKGIYKTAYRILRCNPWSDGGVDKP